MADQKILELLKTEEFSEKMESLGSYAEIQKYFAEKGIDMSEEEICETLHEIGNSLSGEVTEEDLQQVAGGGKFVDAWTCGWNLGKKLAQWESNLYKRYGRR